MSWEALRLTSRTPSEVYTVLGPHGVEKLLADARDTVWRAYFHNDTALLRRYIPPAAATFEGSPKPRWNTRGDIMAGSRAFAASKAKFVDVTFENTEISTSGHTALVRSHYQIIVESAGRRDTMRGRATELFVRQGKTWVNPYWQLEDGAVGTEREIALPDMVVEALRDRRRAQLELRVRPGLGKPTGDDLLFLPSPRA